MNNRRTFLKQSAMLSAGMLLVKPGMLLAKPSNLKVGIQLYSMRDYLPKDVKGTIAKIAKAGYKEVETYGYDTAKKSFWGLSAKEFKTLLSDNGLTSSSGHYGVDMYFNTGKADDQKAYIEAAHALGQSTIVVPYLNDTWRKTVADLHTCAQKINKIAALNKASGLKTGYHNHNFEFEPVDGVMLYDVLLKETDPSVTFEMDLYWVVRAGHDPIKLMHQHPGRFSAWHVKDMDKKDNGINTEVGTGTIDFKKIFAYQKLSGVKHIFMEQENFSMDAYASITQSASYIKNTLLK